MLEVGIRHLPVVENNEFVGMLSIRDLLAIEPGARGDAMLPKEFGSAG